MDHIDPTDITGINERVRAWATPGEQMHPVRIDRIIVADNAVDVLSDEVRTRSAGKRVLLVAAHTPMLRGGDDFKPLIEDTLAHVCEVNVRRLPENDIRRFHADLPAARKLAHELGAPDSDFAAVVSIGLGSITDVVKYARHLHSQETGHKIP